MGDNGAERPVSATRASHRILFWMAVLSTILGALYLLGLLGKLVVDGNVHSASSEGVQEISASIAIVWNVALLTLFAARRRAASAGEDFFAELAVIFMSLVCATSSVNWFVQLAIVPRLNGAEQPGMLAMLDVHNELSITYAMEHLGWGLFFGLAALCAAAASGAGRLARTLRWLWLAGGALSLLHFLGVVTSTPAMSDLGYIAWGVLLPLTTGLMARRYSARQDGQSESIGC